VQTAVQTPDLARRGNAGRAGLRPTPLGVELGAGLD
jgi:hypothetical protein